MTKYDYLIDEIESRYIADSLTLESVDELCELVIDRYFSEAEKDHLIHNLKKAEVARGLGKNPEELHNKKYDKPKTAKKADLRYKYEDSVKAGKKVDSRNRLDIEEDEETNKVKSIHARSANEYDLECIPKSDIAKLTYMKKHANPSDPKEFAKYKTVFRMFCNKYGIKEGSTLYIKFDPDAEWGGEITEWNDAKPLKSLDNKKKTKKDKEDPKEVPVKVPSGYSLVHKTPTDGIKFLKPSLYSNKYVGTDGDNPVNGQYHATGKVYFLLMKDEDINEKNDVISHIGKSKNEAAKHCYKLTITPPNLYLDPESGRIFGSRANPTLNNLLAKFGHCPVYVKTDKPLPVKQLY